MNNFVLRFHVMLVCLSIHSDLVPVFLRGLAECDFIYMKVQTKF